MISDHLAVLDLPADGSGFLSRALPNPSASTPYFVQSGHHIGSVFKLYWEEHGGLSQQGYPISEPFMGVSAMDGRVYTTQFFERAVFELHPENRPPYNILLSLLGAEAYKQKYGAAGAPNQHVATDNPRLFPETKHTIGGVFRQYWEEHGGLAQQGYPISDEFTEVSAQDGKHYTVQYFQRAVFELHPENAGTPNEVLLSQLGTFKAKQLTQQEPPSQNPAPSPSISAEKRADISGKSSLEYRHCIYKGEGWVLLPGGCN